MRIANKALGPSDPRDLLANIPTPLSFQLGNTDTVLYCIMYTVHTLYYTVYNRKSILSSIMYTVNTLDYTLYNRR